MSEQEQARLVQGLKTTHQATLSALAKATPDAVVYQDSGWRVRDLIVHFAAWEKEVAVALRAYGQGQDAYTIPDHSLTHFNQRTVDAGRALTVEQVYAEWETTHGEFVAALEALPPQTLPHAITFMGAPDTVTSLVEAMIRHEEEHRADIRAALQR